LEPGYTLASLDVVSLFTNVPWEKVYDAITNQWHLISRNTAIKKEEFIRAMKLVLDSTFFSFNKIVYKQIFGTPMGSPLSPIVADLVLQDLKVRTMDRLQFKLPIYYRYVDDILLAAPTEYLPVILDTFNAYNERLQFTLEIGRNNGLNFLDVAIIIDDQRIIFDRYEKPSSSGRYVNYHSQHPLSQKISIIFGLIDRVVLLSHPKFHKKNMERIINILLNNCFAGYIFND